VVDRVTGETLCQKRVRLGKTDLEAAWREAKLLADLNHPNVVRFRDAFPSTAEGSDALCIVTELCTGGDLHEEIRARREATPAPAYLSERAVIDLFVQLAMALDHVHSRSVLHRDLKTQNIFLARGTRDFIVKLGDFGVSRALTSAEDLAARTVAGTPYYLAPEICMNLPYSFQSDVWSLGCVLYELCSLRHAFQSESLLGLVFQISKGTVDPLDARRYSPELRGLASELLERDPARRPSLREVLARPFIQAHVAEFRARGGAFRTLADSRGRPTTAAPAGGTARGSRAVATLARPPGGRPETARPHAAHPQLGRAMSTRERLAARKIADADRRGSEVRAAMAASAANRGAIAGLSPAPSSSTAHQTRRWSRGTAARTPVAASPSPVAAAPPSVPEFRDFFSPQGATPSTSHGTPGAVRHVAEVDEGGLNDDDDDIGRLCGIAGGLATRVGRLGATLLRPSHGFPPPPAPAETESPEIGAKTAPRRPGGAPVVEASLPSVSHFVVGGGGALQAPDVAVTGSSGMGASAARLAALRTLSARSRNARGGSGGPTAALTTWDETPVGGRRGPSPLDKGSDGAPSATTAARRGRTGLAVGAESWANADQPVTATADLERDIVRLRTDIDGLDAVLREVAGAQDDASHDADEDVRRLGSLGREGGAEQPASPPSSDGRVSDGSDDHAVLLGTVRLPTAKRVEPSDEQPTPNDDDHDDFDAVGGSPPPLRGEPSQGMVLLGSPTTAGGATLREDGFGTADALATSEHDIGDIDATYSVELEATPCAPPDDPVILKSVSLRVAEVVRAAAAATARAEGKVVDDG